MNSFYKIYNILYSNFGPQGWWPLIKEKDGKFVSCYEKLSYKPLNSKQKLEIALGAILTQNTSWRNVEKALINLKKSNTMSYNSLENIELDKLAEMIKPSGYFNQKARKIKEFLQCNNPDDREGLLDVWGIGPETADSILLYAYNKPFFVIDAYTKRVFARLGFIDEKVGFSTFQKLFTDNLPQDSILYQEYHALLVELCKRNCLQKPFCKDCPLSLYCSFEKG